MNRIGRAACVLFRQGYSPADCFGIDSRCDLPLFSRVIIAKTCCVDPPFRPVFLLYPPTGKLVYPTTLRSNRRWIVVCLRDMAERSPDFQIKRVEDRKIMKTANLARAWREENCLRTDSRIPSELRGPRSISMQQPSARMNERSFLA